MLYEMGNGKVFVTFNFFILLKPHLFKFHKTVCFKAYSFQFVIYVYFRNKFLISLLLFQYIKGKSIKIHVT